MQRIRTAFEDVARRQVEQMERLVERGVASYADEAAQQFSGLVKRAREDAAKRLARELDRSVSVFAREAEAVLAERLAQVGDAGAQRLERRLSDATGELERQRDDWMAGLDQRLNELEADVRRRVEELGADAGSRARGARGAAPGARPAPRHGVRGPRFLSVRRLTISGRVRPTEHELSRT